MKTAGNSRRARISTTSAICFVLLATPSLCLAFDWNGHTVTNELAVMTGPMSIKSGHPLATARAFRLAALRSQGRADLRRAFKSVLGPGWARDTSDAVQTALFGSWLNEVNTNLDLEGNLAFELAGNYLAKRYHHYLQGRRHSRPWTPDSGYDSSNYLHCMHVSGPGSTQARSFDLIHKHLTAAITAAVGDLIVAVKQRQERGHHGVANRPWLQGLRELGSVFHVVEDSAVAATEATSRHVPDVVPGDGHAILRLTSSGATQIVALSSGEFYASRRSIHAKLDNLYRKELIQEVYGAFDPALVTSRLLEEVVLAVHDAVRELSDSSLNLPDGSTNPATDARMLRLATDAGRRIFEEELASRFAPIEERVALPPVPAPAKRPRRPTGRERGRGEVLDRRSRGIVNCLTSRSR